MSFHDELHAELVRRGAVDMDSCLEGPPPVEEVCIASTEDRDTVWLAWINGRAGSVDMLIDAAGQAAMASGRPERARIMLEAAGPKTARLWRARGFVEMDPEDAARVYWDTEPGYVPMEAKVSWLTAKRRLLS